MYPAARILGESYSRICTSLRTFSWTQNTAYPRRSMRQRGAALEKENIRRCPYFLNATMSCLQRPNGDGASRQLVRYPPKGRTRCGNRSYLNAVDSQLAICRKAGPCITGCREGQSRTRRTGENTSPHPRFYGAGWGGNSTPQRPVTVNINFEAVICKAIEVSNIHRWDGLVERNRC